MDSSATFQAPPISVVFYFPCDKVYYTQVVCFFVFNKADCHLTI